MTSEQKALATILLHMRKMMITPGVFFFFLFRPMFSAESKNRYNWNSFIKPKSHMHI